MSHVAAIDLVVKPEHLDLLITAIEHDLGGTVVRGQRTYQWYGRLVGDSDNSSFHALGVAPGVCEHAIRPAGWRQGDYEGGIVRKADGTYAIVWDSYASGAKLDTAFGRGGSRIKDHVGAELVLRAAARRGQRARKTIEADGSISVDVYVEN